MFLIIMLTSLVACGGNTSAPTTQSGTAGKQTIVLGAYTTPREAYGKLIPLFQAKWKAEQGSDVEFEQSYQGSGAQSRAIVEGFEADVAALSLQADIDRIKKADLITHDWTSGTNKGMVSTSIVVFAVREGNPKGIKDWADLAKPGVQILTPNPKTSGGAQWNILALYGAAKRGMVDGVPANDDAAAKAFLASVLKNVVVFDKGARESITNFEKGIGDVAITYENEVIVARKAGQKYDMVIPRSTILIENPIALIDKYVDKHGSRNVTEAFIQYLYSKEAQTIFAEYGLRSVDPEVAKATAAQFPAVQDVFTIQEFGGWEKATPDYFGDGAIYDTVLAQVQK
ncbi:MAG: sulfate ABC transporter substrate-binding protein [Herpetosiphon sp.]|nr:sulfate ABC transporter substrate-binding protein [Herpetosiphon sp.]